MAFNIEYIISIYCIIIFIKLLKSYLWFIKIDVEMTLYDQGDVCNILYIYIIMYKYI